MPKNNVFLVGQKLKGKRMRNLKVRSQATLKSKGTSKGLRRVLDMARPSGTQRASQNQQCGEDAATTPLSPYARDNSVAEGQNPSQRGHETDSATNGSRLDGSSQKYLLGSRSLGHHQSIKTEGGASAAAEQRDQIQTLGFIKNLVYNAYEPPLLKEQRLQSKGGVIKEARTMSREIKQYVGAMDGLKNVLGRVEFQKRASECNLLMGSRAPTFGALNSI